MDREKLKERLAALWVEKVGPQERITPEVFELHKKIMRIIRKIERKK
jgi:hypothetical protein